MENNFLDNISQESLIEILGILDQGNFLNQTIHRGRHNSPFQNQQHNPLHFEEIDFVVTSSTNVDQFGNFGRETFFVFGGNQKSRATRQLKNVFFDGLSGQKAVQDAYRQNPRVEMEGKLVVDAVQPVQKLATVRDGYGNGLGVDSILDFIKLLQKNDSS